MEVSIKAASPGWQYIELNTGELMDMESHLTLGQEHLCRLLGWLLETHTP